MDNSLGDGREEKLKIPPDYIECLQKRTFYTLLTRTAQRAWFFLNYCCSGPVQWHVQPLLRKPESRPSSSGKVWLRWLRLDKWIAPLGFF